MIRHSCSDAPGLFRLFVYGTLKRGYWNHETYCGSAVSVEEATVRGRLYMLPSGIPVLEVPELYIVTHGSADILGDLALQRRLDEDLAGYPECDGEGWWQIEGELIMLQNPTRTVPPIDRLEGFRAGQAGVYNRILVPVTTCTGVTNVAWCYAASRRLLRDARPTGKTSWP